MSLGVSLNGANKVLCSLSRLPSPPDHEEEKTSHFKYEPVFSWKMGFGDRKDCKITATV